MMRYYEMLLLLLICRCRWTNYQRYWWETANFQAQLKFYKYRQCAVIRPTCVIKRIHFANFKPLILIIFLRDFHYLFITISCKCKRYIKAGPICLHGASGENAWIITLVRKNYISLVIPTSLNARIQANLFILWVVESLLEKIDSWNICAKMSEKLIINVEDKGIFHNIVASNSQMMIWALPNK